MPPTVLSSRRSITETPVSFLFAKAANPEALLRRYAILGGTPQYQVWAGDGSLAKIVRERILTKGQPLYDDPLHLLREGEGIRTPGRYLLGSCKWKKVVDERALDQLEARRDELGRQAAQAKLAVFARHGFSDELRRRAAKGEVLLVSAADLFT